MAKESVFEAKIKKEVERLGGKCLKFKSHESGMPDRVVLMPGGRTYWVEVKRPDGLGEFSELQKYQRRQFAALGHKIWPIATENALGYFIIKLLLDQTPK